MKKMSKKIMSAACAAIMATQAAAFTVSAEDYLYYYGGRWYESQYDASLAAGGNNALIESRLKASFNLDAMTKKWSANGVVYDTETEAASHGVVSAVYIPTTSNPYYTTYRWYSLLTRKYYDSYSDALNASGGLSEYVIDRGYYYNDSYYGYEGYYWYSSLTGKVYTTYSAALAASNGNSAYVSPYGTYYSNPSSSSSIYRYYYNGVAYPSLEAAKRAGGTALGVDIYYSPVGSNGSTTYYYYYNGKYYGSLAAAQAAGGTALGVDISYVPYNYYYNGYYNNYYNYYNGYSYYDPYYSYRNVLNNKTSTSSSSKEAEDGEPYIYGQKKKAGWDTIVGYIEKASSGTNINVDMNGSVVVSESVMKALKGKNVSVTFILDNGVKWAVNGKNITDPRAVTIYTEYNIKYIPDSLVKKASQGAVSKAQIGVSTSFDSLGTKASVSVRFNSSKAGCTAIAYRYDPETNSLKGVSKSTVQKDGRCTITVKDGGPYLIVLK